MATTRGEIDPAAPIRGVMVRVKKGRQPAIADLDEAREILARTKAIGARSVNKFASGSLR